MSHKYDNLVINYQNLSTKNLSLKATIDDQNENISKLSKALSKNTENYKDSMTDN